MATAREFFEGLPSRVDASKTAGMNNTYVFEIEGGGTWTVDVRDGQVNVTEGAANGLFSFSGSTSSTDQPVQARDMEMISVWS